MKYSLSVETTPEETEQLLNFFGQLLQKVNPVKVARSVLTGVPLSEEEVPGESAPLEPEEVPAPPDVFVARETRQADTPEAYGDPLEFRVRLPGTPEEVERAWEAWSDFLAAWCSPFSVNSPDESTEYPDRAKLFQSVAGTPAEGRIKQQIAMDGTLNKSVLLWLVNYAYGPGHFSTDDLALNLHDLADKIAGSIAQIASVRMPELLVMYDISPSWRADT